MWKWNQRKKQKDYYYGKVKERSTEAYQVEFWIVGATN